MYVGRIVAVGKTDRPFAGYRVSSRSFPNRIARELGDRVRIAPLDPADLQRNPFIAYACLRVADECVIVSNGTHTDEIFAALSRGVEAETALRSVLTEMGYERDEYNTPRIAGIVTDTTGFLGIARSDGVEVSSFALAPDSCRVICTYGLDRIDDASHQFTAGTAQEAARFMVEGGLFATFEHPVCAAAWRNEMAVYNPHWRAEDA